MGNPLSGDARTARIEAWMDAYGTGLIRLCAACLKDASYAEDAVQDAFLKAYQNLHRFEDKHERSARAWLSRIAVNTCRDYNRAAWLRHTVRGASAEEMLRAREQALPPDEIRLLEDILSLPARQKEVILLRYYQDLTVEEIAEALNVASSTVYARLNKAKAKLRALLERRGEDE